jgi:hypothetical protein
MTSSLLVVFLSFAQIPLRKRRLRPKATFQRNQWNVAGKFRELNESLYVNIIGKYAKINYKWRFLAGKNIERIGGFSSHV